MAAAGTGAGARAAGGGAGGGAGTMMTIPPQGPIDYVPKTPFAPLYRSVFTIQTFANPALSTLLARLAYCNCNYLSTKGTAPTLLQLKQHAQSLIILIKSVTVNTIPAMIDNVNTRIPGGRNATFNDGETYDFLNNLNTAYQGPINDSFKHHHNMPLHALMNIIEEIEDEEEEERHDHDICPMYMAKPSAVNGKSLPYARREQLIAHANDILELLDHEYSAKGGLLAILPNKDSKDSKEKEQYEKSQTTLLGQMIQQHQRLVMRIHDLERQHCNALDALAGEAAVPSQQLNRLGPDARKGRDVVFPQDRFVLANCGEDLWDFLDYEFTKKENSDEAVRLMYKKSGVVGQDMWKKRGQREYERGITCLDVTTRYIRLRKDPLKTVFIIPAHEHHPSTKATRDMEKVPTVVSVVKPQWPERQSIIEMKNREALAELRKLKMEHERTRHDLEVAKNARTMLENSEKHYRCACKKLQQKLDDCIARNKPTETDAINAANAERDALLAEKAVWEAAKQKVTDDQAAIDALLAANRAKEQKLINDQAAFIAARNKVAADNAAAAQVKLDILDAEILKGAADAKELQQKLAAVWKKQIEETGAVLELLKLRKVNLDVQIAGEQAALQAGHAIGTQAFLTAVRDWVIANGKDPNDMQFGMRPLPGSERPAMADGEDVDMGMEVYE